MSGGYQLADNVSLEGRNTFRVPARAAIMADVSRADALAELFDFAMLREGPVMVLGEGSNLLFVGDHPGVVVCLAMARASLLEDDGAHALRTARGGDLHRPVPALRSCARRSAMRLRAAVAAWVSAVAAEATPAG